MPTVGISESAKIGATLPRRSFRKVFAFRKLIALRNMSFGSVTSGPVIRVRSKLMLSLSKNLSAFALRTSQYDGLKTGGAVN
jgi:hypothetical protein